MKRNLIRYCHHRSYWIWKVNNYPTILRQEWKLINQKLKTKTVIVQFVKYLLLETPTILAAQCVTQGCIKLVCTWTMRNTGFYLNRMQFGFVPGADKSCEEMPIQPYSLRRKQTQQEIQFDWLMNISISMTIGPFPIFSCPFL